MISQHELDHLRQDASSAMVVLAVREHRLRGLTSEQLQSAIGRFETEELDAIAMVKKYHRALVAIGVKTGTPCDSVTCLEFATQRVFWPGTVAGEKYPEMCDHCADGLKKIADVMGAACGSEPIPVPTPEAKTRKITPEA